MYQKTEDYDQSSFTKDISEKQLEQLYRLQGIQIKKQDMAHCYQIIQLNKLILPILNSGDKDLGGFIITLIFILESIYLHLPKQQQKILCCWLLITMSVLSVKLRRIYFAQLFFHDWYIKIMSINSQIKRYVFGNYQSTNKIFISAQMYETVYTYKQKYNQLQQSSDIKYQIIPPTSFIQLLIKLSIKNPRRMIQNNIFVRIFFEKQRKYSKQKIKYCQQRCKLTLNLPKQLIKILKSDYPPCYNPQIMNKQSYFIFGKKYQKPKKQYEIRNLSKLREYYQFYTYKLQHQQFIINQSLQLILKLNKIDLKTIGSPQYWSCKKSNIQQDYLQNLFWLIQSRYNIQQAYKNYIKIIPKIIPNDHAKVIKQKLIKIIQGNQETASRDLLSLLYNDLIFRQSIQFCLKLKDFLTIAYFIFPISHIYHTIKNVNFEQYCGKEFPSKQQNYYCDWNQDVKIFEKGRNIHINKFMFAKSNKDNTQKYKLNIIIPEIQCNEEEYKQILNNTGMFAAVNLQNQENKVIILNVNNFYKVLDIDNQTKIIKLRLMFHPQHQIKTSIYFNYVDEISKFVINQGGLFLRKRQYQNCLMYHLKKISGQIQQIRNLDKYQADIYPKQNQKCVQKFLKNNNDPLISLFWCRIIQKCYINFYQQLPTDITLRQLILSLVILQNDTIEIEHSFFYAYSMYIQNVLMLIQSLSANKLFNLKIDKNNCFIFYDKLLKTLKLNTVTKQNKVKQQLEKNTNISKYKIYQQYNKEELPEGFNDRLSTQWLRDQIF